MPPETTKPPVLGEKTMEKQNKDAKKEAMKNLRAQRKKSIEQASAMMKQQKKQVKAILAFLESGEATIPEIAEGVHMPADKTLWYMATLKKYGQIVEGPKDGSFFKYKLNMVPKVSKHNQPSEQAEV
jgi:predicted Rossmann fold nucleotide-binding protein DprA/Smf involved in DNA uptake